MAQDHQQQDQGNPLNDAVEHNATPDGNTDEHRAQDRQNQQNTMAATTATGADAAEQNDQTNNDSSESDPEISEDAGSQPSVAASDTGGNSGSQRQSGNSDSSVQGDTSQQDEVGVDGGGAPQAVGWGTQQRSPSRPDGEGQNRVSQESNEQNPQAQSAGGGGNQASNQSVEQTPFDTETTSETFQVDVANATSKELVIDSDFDTETVSETFEIQVDNVNDEVVVDEQAIPVFEANEDGQIVLSEADLLANASDIDGDDLSVLNLSITNASFEIHIDPETGERSFVVTPDENINGELAISFDVTDGQGSEVASSAVLNVASVNDKVEIDADTPMQFGTQEDSDIIITEAELLANASDVDGDDLSVVNLNVEDATYTTQVDPDTGERTFVITPNPDVNGDLPVTFDVSDGQGSQVVSGATLQVAAVNDAVIVQDDSSLADGDAPSIATFSAFSSAEPEAIEVEEDGQLVISPSDLLANDTDVDGDVLSITAVEATDDTHGTVELDEDGSVVFTPDADYNGPASFTYTVTDGNGSFDTATVSVEVKPVEDMPVAPTLKLDVDEDQVLEIDPAFILSQATDADGDKLSLESLLLKQPSNGNLQLQQDGMYHLITPPDFNGLIELDYSIFDGENIVDGALKVDVMSVNDAPFNSGNAHLTTYEDGGFTFKTEDMLDLFGDVDGDELVVSRVITVDGEDAGEVAQNEDGSWTYTPSDDYSGTAELQIEVSDPSGATTVLDMPVYIRPVADGAVITTDHEGPLVFDEDTTGLLGLNVDMLDTSEQLSHLVITGFPVGFVVSDGENTITISEPGQVLDVTTWSFDDLSLTPPADFTGSFFITVSATTADYGDESSNVLPEATDAYADFDAVQGETLLLTMDDLLEMAEGLEAVEGDEVQGVHLIDRSQGELVDNGDGAWSFTPAEGFEGQVDFAYQVDHNGSLVDVQSSIAVAASDAGDIDGNAAPSVDAIVTTELGSGNDLSFTDADMLAQLTDADSADLTIESVQLVGGQGVLETNTEGQYTFSPAEGFAGQAQIAFVATDGENSIQTHFNVDVAEPEGSEFMLDEMGSLELTQDDLLAALNVGDESTVTAVDYHGEQGTLIEEGDGWVFWSDDDFTGQLPLEVSSSDGQTSSIEQITLEVDEYQDPEASPQSVQPDADSQQNVDTQTTVIENAAESSDISESGEEGSDSDLTAAPGNNVHFEVPDDVAENPDVTQVEISELPDGATIANALLNPDGSYTVSGNLSKPLLMKLSDEFEGEATIQFEGQSELGVAVEGASATVTIDVDDEHAMQSNQGNKAKQPAMQDDRGQNGDWTQGDNTNQGVDVMDDSSSYDNDSSGSQQDDTAIMDENI